MRLVSAIITTHGRLELLKKAIQSVRNQTYPNIELIVVDDCSNDGTRQWAQENLAASANYIYIERENSKGGNHARNIGVEAARGDYLAFLDDDDIWMPTKIAQQVRLLDGNPGMVLSYCGHTKVYENGTRIVSLPSEEFAGNLKEKVFSMVFCTTSMIMIRRSVLDQSGVFDEDLGFWQEYDLVTRICQFGDVGYVKAPLVDILHSATDPTRLSVKIDGWLEAVEYVNKKYQAQIARLPQPVQDARKLMIYNDAANRCAAANDMKRHREFLKKAWEVDRSFKHWLKYRLNITNYRMDLIRQWVRGNKR